MSILCSNFFETRPAIQAAAVAMVLFAAGAIAAADEPRDNRANESHPNVLLILTDDQGWGDLSRHDAPGLETPHLDSLAEEGASFDRFYVSPVCAPTRASLLTGRYHWRTGVHGVTRGQENMRASEATLAEVFSAAGYATGCFGKWHNGASYPLGPIGQGFDRFVGFCAGHWNNYFDTVLRSDRRLPDGRVAADFTQASGYIADALTTEAITFIEESNDRPWLCYVPYNTPHWPPQMPDRYWNLFADRDDLDVKEKAAYAMVANIDDNVGRLLQHLDATNQAADTIVVFLTDNGANSDRWDGNMRGQKGSVHEGGIRVPCFVRYPEAVPAGLVVDEVGMHCDLLPTLAELCHVDLDAVEGAGPRDGRSLASLLRGEKSPEATQPRTIVTYRPPRRGGAARGSILATETRFRATNEGSWKLWNIADDPQQTRDVASQHPDVLATLRRSWEEQTIAPSDLRIEPIPVGYPERPTARLQGHEAVLHGSDGTEGEQAAGRGVSYHGPNGWANDWIDHWTSPAAYPVWTVDAKQAGPYIAELHYRLHPSELPLELTLRADGSEATVTLEGGIDAAPLPSPDRFVRSETYEQQWLTTRIGRIDLAPGEQRLTLHRGGEEGETSLQVVGITLRHASAGGSPRPRRRGK